MHTFLIIAGCVIAALVVIAILFVRFLSNPDSYR